MDFSFERNFQNSVNQNKPYKSIYTYYIVQLEDYRACNLIACDCIIGVGTAYFVL